MKAILLIILISIFTGCEFSPEDLKQLTPTREPQSSMEPSAEPSVKPGTEPTSKPSAEPKETDKPPNNSEKPEEKRIIGTYKTKLVDRKKERVNNIKLAIKAINGKVIEPGEVFSFNDTVGPRTDNRGYEKAYIFIGEEKVLGYGGGICQISSTIYNAAMAGELEIVERHPHEREVDYVPEGKDATVSFGSQDLKFRNTKTYPIKLEVKIENHEIIADVIKH